MFRRDRLSHWQSRRTKGVFGYSAGIPGHLVDVSVCNRLHSRWGDDADTFNPSRWLDGTPYQGDAVGPYANLYVKLRSKRYFYLTLL
jgi:hypothetical protein